MEYLYLIFAILSVFLIAFFILKNKYSTMTDALTLKKEYVSNAVFIDVKSRLKEAELKIDSKNSEIIELNRVIASQEQMIDTLREQNADGTNENKKLHEKLKLDFELLSSKLLEEKGSRMMKQNQEQIGSILGPLKEKLLEFEKKIEHFYVDDNRQRAVMLEQIKNLTELNRLVTDETKNLTRALKGDSKVQGNWGELILERILEFSGLSRGREYEVQQSFVNEEGRRMQPDLIIHLPMGRHIIIDSKVSLKAYEKFCSSSEEQIKNQYLKEHLFSLKRHVDELSAKNYQQLNDINTPDYVLMFVPVEPAFNLILQFENDFMYDAMQRNVIPLGPGTLLATLRTISNLWRQEQQNKNALQIARQGGLLHDKLVSFVEELEHLGDKIQNVQNVYHASFQRLVNGKDNLIQKTAKLRELGAKTSKQLSIKYDLEAEES
jgi:DNA recombination protein RmuC